MRNITETGYQSLILGELPEGCKLCVKGRKSVLFATGLCSQNCWYCTISKKKWQSDEKCINEKEIKNNKDILEEVKFCGSKGVGITGGEPTVKIDRVCSFIKLLKENFGSRFHIHMYSCGKNIPLSSLEKLNKAGLDEIRFHKDKDIVKKALDFSWDVGMEVPVIPKTEKKICSLIDYLEKIEAKFINLNELEFSERNVKAMESRGFKLRNNSLTAVSSSRETALTVLKHAIPMNINVHFCTADLKMNFQLRNRLINRANNIKKPFEKVTRDGFLKKGIVFGDSLEKIEVAVKKANIPYFVNKNRKRIEISESKAKALAKKIKFKVAVVEEYPTSDPWDFELTPLNY